MKLEHHSSQPDLVQRGIDPQFHGKGVAGAESKRKVEPNWVNRSYHYVAGTAPEAMVGAMPYVYESEVPDDKIYDYAKDPMNLRAKSMWGQSLDRNAYEANIKGAGFHGYRNASMQDPTMANTVALFYSVKPHSVKRKEDMSKEEPDLWLHRRGPMNKSGFSAPPRTNVEPKGYPNLEGLDKAKNSREQRAAVFGTSAQPPRLSERRMKMMQHIKNIVKDQLGVDLEIAQGKIDPSTGKLRYPLETRDPKDMPYDVFSPEGVAAEKQRLAQIAEENKTRISTPHDPTMTRSAAAALRRLRAKHGRAPIKRMDPKPDWRSGKLQTQPSPDAAIHEIAHLILSPNGMGLGETQEEMDRQFGEVIAKIGFLKQKMTQGEIQPMALENKIRRTMGLPANKQSMNPKPMSEHGRPVESALDQPTPRFVRAVEQTGKGPKSVDLIRQTRLLSPKNAETFDKFIRGEIVYHPEKGWVPGTSVNAKINQRARAAADDPNPETNFARKDRDTLMRSSPAPLERLKKSAPIIHEELNHMMSRIEDKYVVDRKYLHTLTARLAEKLKDGSSETSVRFNSNETIYLDNQDMEILRANIEGVKPRFKVRIRRYTPAGEKAEDTAYVEIKSKEEDDISKKIRVRIPASMIKDVAEGMELEITDALEKLNRDVPRQYLWNRVTDINTAMSTYALKQMLTIVYHRRAYSGKDVRVTLDDNIRYEEAKPIKDEVVDLIKSAGSWKELTKDFKRIKNKEYLILEVKHEGEPPDWVEDLLKEVEAEPVKFSKYCAAVASILNDGGKTHGAVNRVTESVAKSQKLAKSEGFHEKLTKSENERAARAGLITWPAKGNRSCVDCVFLDKANSFCKHKEVMLKLVDGPENMCCNHYDAPGMTAHGEVKKSEGVEGAPPIDMHKAQPSVTKMREMLRRMKSRANGRRTGKIVV